MKKLTALFLIFCMILQISAYAEFNAELNVQSAILMEQQTGKILYEKNAHESLPPASVTKIMTLLLIFEAIDQKKLTYDTVITASERAKSMGGSTIFLDTNEKMTLNDLIKGIAVASANDACVAVAEHMCGSVEAFVEKMNTRAKELGMKDTNFINCNGLDDDNHYSSAHDIAIMSKELLKHESVFKYTTIWMDSLRNGKFQLANTNKLIRFYPGATGLKTGSTSKAGCCISATAKRDGMNLIAVVMNAPDSKTRFSAASSLLNYGFSNFAVNNFSKKGSKVKELPVIKGTKNSVFAITSEDSAVLIKKEHVNSIKTHLNLSKEVKAPIEKGDKIGEIILTLNGETLGKTTLIAHDTVLKKNIYEHFTEIMKNLLI